MRIGPPSKNARAWSTQGIFRAIEEAGHESGYSQTDDVPLVLGEPLHATFAVAKARGKVPGSAAKG